jgi:hypothetical protein
MNSEQSRDFQAEELPQVEELPRARGADHQRDDYDDRIPIRTADNIVRPHRGGLIAALACLALAFCPPLGLIALSMGLGDIAKINRGEMDATGRSLTRMGIWLGAIISLGYFIALIALLSLTVNLG